MKKIVLFLLIILVLTGCEQKVENSVIKGRVLDENSNPISNVTIFIDELGLTFESDESGDFIISYPFEKKTYSLKFYKEGFVTEEKQVDIIENESVVEIYLKYTTNEKVSKKGVLMIGTDLNNKPLSFVEGTNKSGFEMDLIRRISKDLLTTPVILNVEKENLISSLLNFDVDLVISSISKDFVNNIEDKEKIIYSKTYFIDGYVILVRENDNRIKGFSSLKDKRILVTDKSIIPILNNNVQGIKTIDYESCVETCIKDMQYVLYDAIVTKFSSASYYTKMYKKIKIVNDVLNKEEYVILLRAEDGELLEKINMSLENLIKSNEFYKIYNSWFYPLDKFKVS
ncbi:MAG TPA: transporter substrate-binding domain-containing protein [Caldisericia bacterium]|nr:transporter substrate-binding domain-containing protein [Caldisericia bacterium]